MVEDDVDPHPHTQGAQNCFFLLIFDLSMPNMVGSERESGAGVQSVRMSVVKGGS